MVRRVGWPFIVLYTLAYLGTVLLLIAPLLVTLALKENALVGLDQAPKAFEITADKRRFGATGPCQIVVDTERVPPHSRLETGDR